MSDAFHIALPNGFVIDDELVQQLSWGGADAARIWFRSLPAILEDYCDRWNIHLEPDVPQINYNLVLFGTTPEHGPIVLKMSPPHDEVTAELDALSSVSRPGIVPVIDADPSVSVMLQKRVVPGISLEQRMTSGDIDDERATAIAIEAINRFVTTAPADARLIPLDQWFRSLYAYQEMHKGHSDPLPADVLDVAITCADHLLAHASESCMLHGDLNPGNILWDDEMGWTVIDPKGLVGSRGYEVGTWMINPYGLHLRPDLRDLLDRRLDQLSNGLGIDRLELWQWSIVHAVLSECWTLESKGVEPDHLHALDTARVLLDLPEASR